MYINKEENMKTYQKIIVYTTALATLGAFAGCGPTKTEEYKTIWNKDTLTNGTVVGDTVKLTEWSSGGAYIAVNKKDGVCINLNKSKNGKQNTFLKLPNGDYYEYTEDDTNYKNDIKDIDWTSQPANPSMYQKGKQLFWDYYKKIKAEIITKRQEKQSKLEKQLGDVPQPTTSKKDLGEYLK